MHQGKNLKLLEAEVCPDHDNMLVEMLLSISVLSFVEYLQG